MYKRALGTLVCLTGLSVAGWSASTVAQDFPSPIKLIVPFPPGGSTDALARVMAPQLSKTLGQTIVVENRPGASGQIAAQALKNAPADGSTFMLAPDHVGVMVPLIMPTAGYETLKDFLPVGQAASYPIAMSVSMSTGAKTLKEYVEYVKRNPARANFGVPVVGGAFELVGYKFGEAAGVKMTAVPYNGSAPMMTGMMGDSISSGVMGLPDGMEQHRGGKIRTIAVTGDKRSPIVPDVPTFDELGFKGLNVMSWHAFFAPKGLPRPMAEKFNRAISIALQDPEVKKRLADMALEAAPTSLDGASKIIADGVAFWTPLMKAAGNPPAKQ